MPINYKDYPKNWKEIRQRVLERENHCCKFCGVHNYSYRENSKGKLTNIVLTIAHLDHDKLNHEVTDDRLAALCQKCHLQYDMKNHIANRKRNLDIKRKQINLF